MKKIVTSLLVIFISLFFSKNSIAQTIANTNENANILRQNGQIYLVVLVLVTIFAGIIFYLYRIEKKLNHLEKNKK